MKTAKELLAEHLNQAQTEYADKLPQMVSARKRTDHFFGKGEDDKIEPLKSASDDKDTEQKSDLHKKIEQHLDKKLSPKELSDNATTDKHNRTVKISKLLGAAIKDKAEAKNTQDEYARSLQKSNSPDQKLSVRTSRSKRQIVNSTSSAPSETGHVQPWHGASCLNIGDAGCKGENKGVNAHYIKAHVKQALPVSHLIDDKGNEHARANYDLYTNEEGDHAFKLGATYGKNGRGSASPEFDEHAKKNAEKMSSKGIPKNPILTKHKDIYDDNGVDTIIHPNATKEQLDDIAHKKYETKEDYDAKLALAKDHNIHPDHAEALAKDNDESSSPSIHASLAANPSIPEQVRHTLAKSNHSDVRRGVAMNPSTTSEELHHLSKDCNLGVRLHALQHKNTSDKTLDDAIDSGNKKLIPGVSSAQNLKEYHIQKLINKAHDKPEAIPENSRFARISQKAHVGNHYLARNPILNSKHLDALKDNADERTRENVARHPNTSSDTLEHMELNNRDDDIVRAIAGHKNRSEYTGLQLAHHPDRETVIRNADNPSNTPAVTSESLKHPDAIVRRHALENTGKNSVTKEHVEQGLNDKMESVRNAALQAHERLSKESK